MSVVVVAEVDGGNKDFFEQVSGKAMPGVNSRRDARCRSRVPSKAAGA